MDLQNKKDTLIIRAADKSKDSHKISGDLANIWRVCGYSSKEKLDELFKRYKGMALNEYCRKLNPSCSC